jgi:hypothetical protein
MDEYRCILEMVLEILIPMVWELNLIFFFSFGIEKKSKIKILGKLNFTL